MTKLIDTLNNEEKITAQEIIKQLTSLHATANKFQGDIEELKKELTTVDSMKDFHDIVQKIINKKKEIRHSFANERAAMHKNDDISNAVKEYLNDEVTLHSLLTVLQPSLILKEDIIATKERITQRDLLIPLNGTQRAIVEKFITDVKGLQNLASNITLRKHELQEQLNEIDSLDELNALEDEIETQDKQLVNFYTSSVTYPDDEEAAGVLINFLEQNPHIQKIMKSFELYEPLMDNILRARIDLEKNANLRP